jgi:uncharacterized protein (DUF849 family)
MEAPSPLTPAILTVAPNGARKTHNDHPMLPISPTELADEAAACLQQGAAMIHLHVRDDQDQHTLDVKKYKEAIAAIRDKVGEDIVIQATTEAVGIYSSQQQMDTVLELKPEAASLAIKELVPEGREQNAQEFFNELRSLQIMPQFILYSPEDLQRFERLTDEGIIPFKDPFLLFVLGRYTKNQTSHPHDLIPFLRDIKPGRTWSVCAFGPLEHAAASAALTMGGHVRVGFENNMTLKDGTVAGRNADLLRQVRDVAEAIGRPIATAADLRRLFVE